MGALLGAVGHHLFFESETLSHWISIVLGASILIWGGIHLFFKDQHPFKLKIPTIGLTWLTKQSRSLSMFMLGLGTVLLPCMTLTPVLGLSITTGSARTGALLLFSFFLGTVPAIAMSGVVSQMIVKASLLRSGQRISHVFFCIAGIVTILRAFH